MAFLSTGAAPQAVDCERAREPGMDLFIRMMLGITPCKVNEMENPQFTSKALGEGRARSGRVLLLMVLELEMHRVGYTVNMFL